MASNIEILATSDVIKQYKQRAAYISLLELTRHKGINSGTATFISKYSALL